MYSSMTAQALRALTACRGRRTRDAGAGARRKKDREPDPAIAEIDKFIAAQKIDKTIPSGSRACRSRRRRRPFEGQALRYGFSRRTRARSRSRSEA